MFSSAILDVVIGLIFCLLTVSLMASAVVEMISSAMKWRSKHLLEGIKQLVNDPGFEGLALRLYQHAAVNPRGLPVPARVKAPLDGTADTGEVGVIGGAKPTDRASNVVIDKVRDWTRALTFEARSPAPGTKVDLGSSPAYVDGKQFASALTDILKLSDSAGSTAAADAVKSMKAALDQLLKPAVDGEAPAPIQADPQLHLLLTGIVQRCQGDIQKIQVEIGAWFDNGMDRLSGAYKRQTQALSFVVALVLAILVNVDAIRVVHVLWSHPELVNDLKAPEAVAKSFAERNAHTDVAAATSATAVPTPTAAQVTKGLSHDAPAASELLAVLDDHLPVGWTGQESKITLSNALSKLLGWLITAVATLFGAPFWFDTLQAFVRLKGTGPSPRERADDRAAAA